MSAAPPRLHLASASPRRREILSALGLTFSHGSVGIDEQQEDGESAADMVQRLAADKARAAARQLPAGTVVLGSDTAVVLDGRVFGKPADEAEAVQMLLGLSGRTHDVMTGVATVVGTTVDVAMSLTRVRFRDINQAEARIYWQSGEPADKAGGYGIQGLGGVFVASLDGSYSGVVGLPVFETALLLERAGIPILQSGRANRS